MSTHTSVEDVAWDLEPLVEGQGDAGVDRLLDDAQQRADAFARRHAGRIAELDGPGLAAAMAELERINDLAARAGNYAMLRFSVDTADPAVGALLARVQERGTQIETRLLFVELEWAALDDARAEELLQAPGLDTSRHFLRAARRYRPHLLSEPEEKILAEKSVSGRSAWSRLFSEHTSAITVDLPGESEPVALDSALSRLMSPRRETREQAAGAITQALVPGLRTRAFIFNTLLVDKATDDRLRAYPHWLAARNLANEASDESRGGRWSAPSADATPCPSAGIASRYACWAWTASRTSTAWPPSPRRTRTSAGRSPRDRPRRLPGGPPRGILEQHTPLTLAKTASVRRRLSVRAGAPGSPAGSCRCCGWSA